jgi:N-acetyltransferase
VPVLFRANAATSGTDEPVPPDDTLATVLDFVEPVVLRSSEIELVPLEAQHAPALLGFIEERMWRGMLSPQPRTVDDVVEYVSRMRGRRDSLAFAVLDATTGEVRGSTVFYELVEHQGRVEIGYTFYGRQFWGRQTNPRCKLLMLRHAFDTWGVYRVALRCDVRNARSIAAIERLGAVREGLLRGHRLASDGARSDTLVFSVIAPDWPAVRAGLERRLDAGT